MFSLMLYFFNRTIPLINRSFLKNAQRECKIYPKLEKNVAYISTFYIKLLYEKLQTIVNNRKSFFNIP